VRKPHAGKRLRIRERRARARFLRLSVFVVAALLACSCAGGAKPLSEKFGFLPPGRYVTDVFEPALSFEVGEGWELTEGVQQEPYFEISRANRVGDPIVAVAFNNPPPEVSDPTTPDRLVPAPEGWVSWFREHPYLETSEPSAASIGGVEGRRFDHKVTALPEDYHSEDCLGYGVPLWPLPGGHHWCADEGYTSRTTVMKVGGETVIVDVYSGSGTLEEVLPEAQKVLGTVEWEGA
jgi:hypothetical protein